MTDFKNLIDQKVSQTFYIVSQQSKYSPKKSSLKSHRKSKIPPNIPKSTLTPKSNQDQSIISQFLSSKREKSKPRHSTSMISQRHEDNDPYKAHKKLALAQHPLLVECIKGWWNVMDPHGENEDQRESGTRGFITKDQYVDFNLRVQKTIQNEFYYEEAKEIAEEDWNIDAEEWYQMEAKAVNFDKFLDFLCEIAESWNEITSIEGVLVSINAIMLNISYGVHLNTSLFKELNSIEKLPQQFHVEIDQIQQSSKQQISLEFIKWYQTNFLEPESIRKEVQGRLMKIFPYEARINDIWIEQAGYNQTAVLLQCTTRLESLLNQIKKQPVLQFLEKSKPLQNKTSTSFRSTRYQSSKVPTLPILTQNPEEEPTVYSNRISFTRKVNLSLLGQSISARPPGTGHISQDTVNQETYPMSNSQNSKREVNISLPSRLHTIGNNPVSETPELTHVGTNSQLFGDTPLSNRSSKRIVFTRSRSLLEEQAIEDLEFKKITRKFSLDDSALFEDFPDPEYSRNINYKKSDVKYHKINKKWRTGKYFRENSITPETGLGNVNKKSPDLFIQEKRMIAQQIISRNNSPDKECQAEEKHNISQQEEEKSQVIEKKTYERSIKDETDREVGFKVTVRVSPSQKRNQFSAPVSEPISRPRETYRSNGDNSVKTAPINTGRITNRTTLTAKVIPAEYTFEDYAHLLQQPKKPEKMVFYDNLEFFCALNKAKHEFNKTYQSEFIRNYKMKNDDYRSRRDELEGVITDQDWREFIQRLENLLNLTKKRRRMRRARRKRRGMNLILPKFINGTKQPNLQKNRLWKSVFINANSKNADISKNNNYLYHIHNLGEGKFTSLPPPLQRVVNETTKIPRPPTSARPKNLTNRKFSPARYKSPENL
ncbi:unnamed protein product [Blepharisma stoltei]|uniref:Uncharacterized protein n=1 Tax=Blepharisma stoltei TaxID=1481888 RepID=A0AAU9JFQ6_9CILI|nr:unnamed protein product [Blepharisma stoltei]